MTMTRRATGRATGKIEQFTGETNDGAIICQACTRIVVSRTNLERGHLCPYCHHDVNTIIEDDVLDGDILSYDDDDDDDEIIALPC